MAERSPVDDILLYAQQAKSQRRNKLISRGVLIGAIPAFFLLLFLTTGFNPVTWFFSYWDALPKPVRIVTVVLAFVGILHLGGAVIELKNAKVGLGAFCMVWAFLIPLITEMVNDWPTTATRRSVAASPPPPQAQAPLTRPRATSPQALPSPQPAIPEPSTSKPIEAPQTVPSIPIPDYPGRRPRLTGGVVLHITADQVTRSSRHWVPTGMMVTRQGLEMEVFGQGMKAGLMPFCGVEGCGGFRPEDLTVARAKFMAVLGRIGDGDPFPLGKGGQLSVTTRPPGQLSVSVNQLNNDDLWETLRGSFDIRIVNYAGAGNEQ